MLLVNVITAARDVPGNSKELRLVALINFRDDDWLDCRPHQL